MVIKSGKSTEVMKMKGKCRTLIVLLAVGNVSGY